MLSSFSAVVTGCCGCRFDSCTANAAAAYHLQRILLVAGEHLTFEHFELFAIGAVLAFAPAGILAVLHAPMAREHWRQHLELIAGQKHFVHLRRDKERKKESTERTGE